MERKLIIGDIHGCLQTFKSLLKLVNLDKETDSLILLGDFIDRGPDSKGVIDEIINLKKAGYKISPIKGNHEEMLLSDYIAETEKGWFEMASEEFKTSFGIDNLKQLPTNYVEFCKRLPFYILDADFIAVHAGLNFEHEDPLIKKEDLMWIRDWYKNIDYDWLQKRKIIHGHTPQTRSEIEAQFDKFNETQVLNIDCGVFLSKSKIHGLGNLCAFDITNEKLYFQENIDKHCKF